MNWQMASRILCLNLATLKWEGDRIQLNVPRLNPATCFTKSHLYVFGGLGSSGEDAIAYVGEIERIEAEYIQTAQMDRKCDIIRVRNAGHRTWLKFMDGVAVLINSNQIMIFGGLRDPDYDEEIDGLLYNWKNNTCESFRESWGITRTAFHQPGFVIGSTLLLAQ